MGGSAHCNETFDDDSSQMEEDEAGQCREHDGVRSGWSECSHHLADRPRSSSTSQSPPAAKDGPQQAAAAFGAHKAVTVGQVVKAISQLGERKGSTMNQIRNALSAESRDLERPPSCCVKRALVRGLQSGHLERTCAPVGRTSRFLLQAGSSRQLKYRLPRRNTAGRGKTPAARKAASKQKASKPKGKKPQKGKKTAAKGKAKKGKKKNCRRKGKPVGPKGSRKIKDRKAFPGSQRGSQRRPSLKCSQKERPAPAQQQST